MRTWWEMEAGCWAGVDRYGELMTFPTEAEAREWANH